MQPLLYDFVLIVDRVERQATQNDGFTSSVAAELLALLEKYGVTRIPVTRDPFNPGEHQPQGIFGAGQYRDGLQLRIGLTVLR